MGNPANQDQAVKEDSVLIKTEQKEFS